MATIDIHSWSDLIEQIQLPENVNNDYVWHGEMIIDEIELQVPNNWDECTYECYGASIDFRGLKIKNIRTFCDENGRNFIDNDGSSVEFPEAEREYHEANAWMNGFCVFGVHGAPAEGGSVIIQNLIIEHINLENPRDIVIGVPRRGSSISAVAFKNIYVFDVYSPSANRDSIWLQYSGDSTRDPFISGYSTSDTGFYVKKLRAVSAYLVRTHLMVVELWQTSPKPIIPIPQFRGHATGYSFSYSCINITTSNAGIFFPNANYWGCDLNFQYRLDWKKNQSDPEENEENEEEESEIFSHLCLFPAPNLGMGVCTFKADVTLDSDMDFAISDMLYSDGRVVPTKATAWEYGRPPWMQLGTSLVFDIAINNVNNTCNIIENPDFSFDDRLWNSSTPKESIIFVTNHGYHWQTVPENIGELLLDLKNLDILAAHDMGVVEDDGDRWLKYNTPENKIGESTRRKIHQLTNDGYPFLPLWYYPYEPDPDPKGKPDYEYICVFDMQTKQDKFEDNGLAILTPTACKVTEELNGGWNVILVHPKDPENRWRYILEMNILKVLGQLFIIRKVTVRNAANSQSVTAYAEHISYHLNDYWLFPGTSIAAYTGEGIIKSIQRQMYDGDPEKSAWQTRYTFQIESDLDSVEDLKEWYDMPEGHTAYEMLIGNNGFTSLVGGELYRDNFYMSINERMEFADDNAFELHPALNLKAIEKTVDLQTFCTYFKAYDQYGGWWAVSWDPSTMPRRYPHNVVRSQNFTFDVDPEYYSFSMLERKGQDFFKRNCAPLVSFKIQVQDLKHHPDYKDFTNNYRFKVGDIGKIWDEDEQRYYELEVTKTVHDGITGECIEVVIGTERSFTRPASYPITLDRNYKWDVIDEYDPDNPPDPPEPPYEPTTIDDYIYTESEDAITLILYIGSETRVLVPAADGNNKPVKYIKSSCFDGNFKLEAVTVPENIEVIE